jgi:hypothetical protein
MYDRYKKKIILLCLVQNYYPERLGKALMIHVPYIFMKAWKMIYPFIDTNTRDKVIDVFLMWIDLRTPAAGCIWK